MIDLSEAFEMRRKLREMDDGSQEYTELFNLYSWFLQALMEFKKKYENAELMVATL